MNSVLNILIYIGIGIVAAVVLLFINLFLTGSYRRSNDADDDKSTAGDLIAATFAAFETLIAGTLALPKIFLQFSWLKALGLMAIFVVIWEIVCLVIVVAVFHFTVDKLPKAIYALFLLNCLSAAVMTTLYIAFAGFIN